MLFHFQVLKRLSCLSVVFLYDSNMVREHTLNEFSSFKFVGVCFMPQDSLFWGMTMSACGLGHVSLL